MNTVQREDNCFMYYRTNKDGDEVVEKIGIRYIILNMNKIESVSLECINHIKKYNNKLLKKKKYLLICDSNSRRRRLFKNIISNIDSELDAFSLI